LVVYDVPDELSFRNLNHYPAAVSDSLFYVVGIIGWFYILSNIFTTMKLQFEQFIASNLKAFKMGEINSEQARGNLLKVIPSIPCGDKRYIKNKIFSYNKLFK
jgi:hypothetical protein